MSRKYKFGEKDGAYFISFATVFWIDVFTRMEYFDIIINSLRFCRKEKGMIIFGYCIMPSHIHLIFRSSNEKPSELIRDFKGFTSRKIVKAEKNGFFGCLNKQAKEIQMLKNINSGNKIINL